MNRLPTSLEFGANAETRPCYIGRGRISDSTLHILDDHQIATRVSEKFIKLGLTPKRPIIVWDPHISQFIDTTPDIRGGFTKASSDPKFANRKILHPQDIESMIGSFKGGHFIVPFAISGDSLPERFMQLLDLLELIVDESKGDYTLDVILTKPYGDRNDKDHKREGYKLFNAKSISTISRILKNSFNVNRVYMEEPHSFNAMRLVQEYFNGKAHFPSLAKDVSHQVLSLLEKKGLGVDFSMDDVVICPPDGGMKHLVGSAHFLGYLASKGYDVPKPGQYDRPELQAINRAYADSFEYYSANPQASFDWDRNDGPQASIQRAWINYCYLKGLPANKDVPLLLEDFPQDFALYDKERGSDKKINRLTLIHGDIEGKRIISIDDVSATGSTMVTCANESYTHGATEFIAVLNHGGFVRFEDPEDKKLFDGSENGLHFMLTRKHPLHPELPLFPTVMFSKSAPSAEEYRTKLLPDNPELHDRVVLIDVAETVAECVIDGLLQEQYHVSNPDLALMTLPEVRMAEIYHRDLGNHDQLNMDLELKPQAC